MTGRILLDTNVVIDFLRGDAAVEEQLLQADEIFVPAVALGELFYGALRSDRSGEHVDIIRDFEAECTILPCDRMTATEYATIKNALRVKGRPIPENDIWIAAIARQHDLALATRDDHFNEVEEITRENW